MTNKELLLSISETAFTNQVLKLAKVCGWRVVHFRPARVLKDGVETWRTAGQGDIVGFPDIVALKDKRLVVIELKSEDAPCATEEQHAWLVAFHAIGAETHIARPSDWPDILKVFDPEGRLK